MLPEKNPMHFIISRTSEVMAKTPKTHCHSCKYIFKSIIFIGTNHVY